MGSITKRPKEARGEQSRFLLLFGTFLLYFSRKNRLIIVPDSGHFSRILFSR